jgi:hypothetical protein
MMAVREFRDHQGTVWRTWEIRPEAIHPVTRGEDYLADCFVVGWLVFETLTGGDKRRLCPYPRGWTRMTEGKLRELLSHAEKVPRRKLEAQRQDVHSAAPEPEPVKTPDPSESEDKPDVTDFNVVRSFRYPGGRLWTVCVVQHPEDGSAPALRFNAGARNIDLRPWPKDWVDAPNERLVELLRQAAPRDRTGSRPDTGLRRRWNDGEKGLGAGMGHGR